MGQEEDRKHSTVDHLAEDVVQESNMIHPLSCAGSSHHLWCVKPDLGNGHLFAAAVVSTHPGRGVGAGGMGREGR